jgi:hypothetical protein
MADIREICHCSSIREASILLNEAIIGEERYGICFQLIEEDIQHISHP